MRSFAVLQRRYDLAANAIKSIKNKVWARYHVASISESAARVSQFCEEAEHLMFCWIGRRGLQTFKIRS